MKQNKIKLHYFLLKTISRFQTGHPYPNVYKSLPVRIGPDSQRVRKGIFAEISAFQQFVKAENYSKILVISTIFSVLSDSLVWNSNTAKIPFSSPFIVVW